MKTNFHTHTERCFHAIGKEIDYVHAAIGQGVSVLGFSDHAPFPDTDFGLRMHYESLEDYLHTIDNLASQFKGTVTLYKGLEIEYIPAYLDYYRSLYEEHGLEYLALGEHIYQSRSGNLRNIFSAQSTEDYIDYANAIAEALGTGLFTFLAHPDVMFINSFDWDQNCDKACDIILSAAEQYAVPMEFNANGVRRGRKQYPDGIRFPYPHMKFWEKLRGSKHRIIIGSDAHVPEQIYDNAVEISGQICQKLNLNVIENIFEVGK